ncbi:MAG: iron complex outermembrane receptor protein [Halioglobus sp.]
MSLPLQNGTGSAVEGVANVIGGRMPTSVEEGFSGGGEIRHDSVSDMDTIVARLDAGVGDFAWHVDGLYRDWTNLEVPGYSAGSPESLEEATRGHIENTDGITSNFTLGASYHLADGFAGMAVSRLENDYGIPPGGHEEE